MSRGRSGEREEATGRGDPAGDAGGWHVNFTRMAT
jgi:hypothetical protein